MSNQVYARPALLITHTRSGGTMLNYALSTHQRIFWTRGEPMLRAMEWGKAFPDASNTQILECITRASFYTAAGCKVTYEQFTPDVYDWIESKPRISLLHLVRENMIRVAVSQMLTGMVCTQQLKHRAHSFDVIETPKVHLDPASVLARANKQDQDVTRRRKMLEKLGKPVMELTYQNLVGGHTEVDRLPEYETHEICKFLGVRYEVLRCDLRRVNRAPLSEIIENWEDVKKHVGQSRWEWCLNMEEEPCQM